MNKLSFTFGDFPAVEVPIVSTIGKPEITSTSYVKEFFKHEERCIKQADKIIEKIKHYFVWYVSQNIDPKRQPSLKNVLKQIGIEPLKYPWIFCNSTIEDYFIDSVAAIFRDAKKKHGHRSTFVELDFTYFSAVKQNLRPKLLFHKKGSIPKR